MITMTYPIDMTSELHAALGDTVRALRALLGGREITPEDVGALRVAQALIEEVAMMG
jgi:hypothetical protein